MYIMYICSINMVIKTPVYPLCSLKSRKLQNLWILLCHPFWLQTPSLLATFPNSYYPEFWMIHFFSFVYNFITYAHISKQYFMQLCLLVFDLYISFPRYSFVTCFSSSAVFWRHPCQCTCHFTSSPFLSSSL